MREWTEIDGYGLREHRAESVTTVPAKTIVEALGHPETIRPGETIQGERAVYYCRSKSAWEMIPGFWGVHSEFRMTAELPAENS